MEKDLSLKQQFLDIVIIKKQDGLFPKALPDGFEHLTQYNLLSYKSMCEPFDDWVLKELTGHYVNYRKQISPSLNDLIHEKKFTLYGISTRFPQKLSKQVELIRISDGHYKINRGTDRIYLIVLSQISKEKKNGIWNLFSAIPDRIEFASSDYKKNSQETSTIINQLFEYYNQEGIAMSYTMQDFQKDYVREHLNILSSDEVLKNYSSDEVLKNYSSDEVLKNYSSDEKLKGLSLNEIQEYLKKNF